MILVVYAHPGTEGFNSRILDRVTNTLKSKQREYEVLDLYESGYDPVLKQEELYTAGNKKVSPRNSEFQNRIEQASGMIFIYPIWWGGMPAILKGFIDRVFTPGFAFKYRKDKFISSIPDKYLTDKKVACFVTSGGPAFFYALLLNPIKIINKYFIFGFFGAKSKTFQLYSAKKLEDFDAGKIDKKVEKGMKWFLK